MKFTEYLKNRGEGKELPTPPWYLHDKLKCYQFCHDFQIPTVKVLAQFEHPDDISFRDMPDHFVLKPNYHSSSIGVMVLTKRGEDYFDAMTRTTWAFEQIKEKQLTIHNNHPKKGSKWTIIEEKVTDHSGNAIPYDFKAYAFKGEIAFILRLDRNDRRPVVSWYDGHFEPLADQSVYTNEDYLSLSTSNRPEQWNQLLSLARQASLAAPTPFASIDMYNSTSGPILGEITLVPGGFYFGKYFILSERADKEMGQLWGQAARNLQSPGAGAAD